MKREIGLKLIFCAVIGLAVFTAGASQSAVYGQECSKVSDQEIVDSINSAISNNSKLAAQMQHINVTSFNQAVKLYGWTDTSSDYRSLVDIVMTTKCARVLNVNDFRETPPDGSDPLRSANGCTRGTKPCGQICIPESEACNIKQ